jgi:MFS family permease
MWTGLTLGATPTVTAISAPLWGRVGDRYGSKVLVIRSLIAFILTKAGMAFVTAPWQLFALRALLGLFAGYGALTISMAAESAPRDRMAQAIGMVQTGHRLGPAVGPVIGGLLAPIVGLRRAFLFAAAFYVVALIAIVVFYKEPREGTAPRTVRGGRAVLRHLFRLPGFLLALGVIFGLADRRSQLRAGAAALCCASRRPGHPHSDRDRRPVLAGRAVGGVRPPPRRAL